MKRFSKRIVLLLCCTAVLLSLSFYFFFVDSDDTGVLSFVVAAGNTNERIDGWKQGKDVYVFLPSYAEMSEVFIEKNTGAEVKVDGHQITNGMQCGVFLPNEYYAIEYKIAGKTIHENLIFIKSDNIPAVYIDTSSGSMEYIHAKKGNEETGNIRLYMEDGSLGYMGELKGINGRGNSTWEFYEKKPYSLSLSAEADLLGMGTAQEWILLANAGDASHLRNKMVYDFSDVFGLNFSPKAEWVDLYLNGEYHGLYLLCERNEIHPSRVDVSADTGCLVSSDMEERIVSQGESCIVTSAEQALRIRNLSINSDALSELKAKWQSIENAFLADDGLDHLSGKSWLELIDLESWSRKYLIEEVLGNFDAAFLSQYYYSDETKNNGKVFAGPVWDYDYSMGCKECWQLSTPNALFADRLHVKTGYDTPWFYALCRKDEFRSRMLELYQAEFLPLLDELLNEKIDAYVQQIRASADANGIRWSQETEIVSEAEYIKQYMIARREFLNSIWLKGETYHQVRADSTHGDNYGYYFVRSGECLTELHAFENNESQEFIGWYYTDTDVPFDASLPIHEDISIYAKWQDTSEHKLNQILKLIPLGIIAVLLTIFVIAEIRRNMRRK